MKLEIGNICVNVLVTVLQAGQEYEVRIGSHLYSTHDTQDEAIAAANNLLTRDRAGIVVALDLAEGEVCLTQS